MFFPTLGSIASKEVLTVRFTARLDEAVQMMHARDHRDIIVTNDSLFYVLTTVDLITFKLNSIDFSQPLSSLELQPVPVMQQDDNVINAVDLIQKDHEYICIVDASGTLTGIVTNSDIVASVDPQVMLENISLETFFETRHHFSIVERTEPMSRVLNMLLTSIKDCVIVADRGKPVGIVTSKDILHYFNNTREDTPVSQYMSSPLQTVSIRSTIKDALLFIQEKLFKRIVVVDADDELVGIISQEDLISQTYLRWTDLMKEHYEKIEELSHILEQKNRKLMKLATKDRLTGINNRHIFEEQFGKEQSFAQRYRTPLHLLIMDIDRFKTINDTHGHLTGDTVLQEFASLIEAQIRRSDLFARWGGEEFVLLMHNNSDTDARSVAEKLRSSIAGHAFRSIGSLTCSIGLCRIDPGCSLDENLSRADQALYTAKHQGRNQTCFHHDPDKGTPNV